MTPQAMAAATEHKIYLPEQSVVRLRLEIYLLACEQFLQKLEMLESVLALSSRLSLDRCIDQFDSALDHFLNYCTAESAEEALKAFRLQLRARMDGLDSAEPEVRRIFGQILTDMARYLRKAEWNGEHAFHTLYSRGRDLAHGLFAADMSDHPASEWIAKRLTRVCPLRIRYASGRDSMPLTSYEPIQEEVQATFSTQHTFDDYTTYLFGFLHEYSAHVYAADNGGTRHFNDGWMVYAAQAFFEMTEDIYSRQKEAFERSIRPKMHTSELNAYGYAEELHRSLPEKYRLFLGEMAAFEPRDGQPPDLHARTTSCLFILSRYADRDSRKRLQRELRQAQSIWDLIPTLRELMTPYLKAKRLTNIVPNPFMW